MDKGIGDVIEWSVMGSLTINDLFDIVAKWVFVFSIINILLPPIEFFNDFPKVQKVYSFIVHIVKYYGALDFRGKVMAQYDSYKNKNGDGQNPSTGGK